MEAKIQSVPLVAGASISDREAYNRFVDESPQGILYCHTWWLDAVAPDRYDILTLKNGDTIKAAWPVVYPDLHDLSKIEMPPLTQKLGILFAPSTAKYAEVLSDEHRLTQQLIDQIPQDVAIRQRFHENFTNWLPFYWAGFTQTTRYTYLIENLRDLDAVWKNLRTAGRQHIRNAQKNGIRVREIDDIELLYQVDKGTFERQEKEVPFSLEVLSRIDSACRQHAGRRMLVAEDSSGAIHACDYLIYDEQCAISLVQGAHPDLRKSCAQPLLDWESIQFASTVSKKFDFEGSMIPNVERYNRDFGARQAPYFQITRSTRPKEGRRGVRAFLGRALRKLAAVVDPTNS